jgi:MRG-binding protein
MWIFLIGMYKHFRMISISNALSSHGYSYNSSSGSHTRIPGIWAKLQALYDLDALDEREDRHAGYITPDPSSVDEDGGEEEEEEGNSISWQEFALNEEEFGEMMWARRLKGDSSEGKPNRRLHASVDGHSSPEAIEGLSHTRPVTGLFPSRDGTAEAEDTVSPKGKGKKNTGTASTKVRGRGVRGTPAEEHDEEDEEEAEEEEDGSTQAGSTPSRATVKGIKKNKAVSSARRRMRKR